MPDFIFKIESAQQNAGEAFTLLSIDLVRVKRFDIGKAVEV